MSHITPPLQSTLAYTRAVSRRRLLAGLAGSGALLLLGSPSIYATIKNVQREFTTRPLDLSDAAADAVIWSNDLEYAAVGSYSSQTRLYVWDYEQGQVIYTFNVDIDKDDSAAAVWSPDNQRLVVMIGHIPDKGTSDTRLTCWNVQTQQQLYSARGDFYLSLGTPSWSPDAQKLAVFYESRLFLLNASNGQTLYIQEFSGQKSIHQGYTIEALTWSPDSKNVALLVKQFPTNEYSVVIWDVAKRQQTAQLGKQIQDTNKGQDTPLAWSPKGDYLATILNKKLQFLHVSDSRKNVTFPEAFKEIYHLLAWDPDGRYLAASDSGQIGIWDSVEKEQVRALYRGEVAFRIEKLAWPRDGQQINLINDSNELVHLTW